MPLSVIISITNPAVEAQIKDVLTAEGFAPGETDATISAALRRLIQRELRNLFFDRLRERVQKDAGDSAVQTLRTRIEGQI